MGRGAKTKRTVPMIRIPHHEWPKLVLALRKEGYTKRCISDYTGLSIFLLDKILKGEDVEPSHYAGEAILKLTERIQNERQGKLSRTSST